MSRDLLCGACRKLHRQCRHPEYDKKLHYGQWLYGRDIGFVRINDVMGAYTTQRVKGRKIHIPIKQHIDVWVGSLAEEKAFFKKHGIQPVELFKVEIKEN